MVANTILVMMIDSAAAGTDPWWQTWYERTYFPAERALSGTTARRQNCGRMRRHRGQALICVAESSRGIVMNHLPQLWSAWNYLPVGLRHARVGVCVCLLLNHTHTHSEMNVKLLAFAFPGNCSAFCYFPLSGRQTPCRKFSNIKLWQLCCRRHLFTARLKKSEIKPNKHTDITWPSINPSLP